LSEGIDDVDKAASFAGNASACRSISSLGAKFGAFMTTPIAERKLLFSEKGQTERKPLVIRIYAPRPVEPNSPLYRPDQDTARCFVEFDGIPDASLGGTFGADSLQALQLAADVEPTLKRLSLRYDFFFPTGGSYFDE
jgi:hypothetical protein